MTTMNAKLPKNTIMPMSRICCCCCSRCCRPGSIRFASASIAWISTDDCACTAVGFWNGEGIKHNANTAHKAIFRTFIIINLLSRVKGYKRTLTRPLKTGAVRSKDGFLHTDQSAALLRALKIYHYTSADAPLSRSTPLFWYIDYLHTAKPLVCEVNQSVLRRLLNVDEL